MEEKRQSPRTACHEGCVVQQYPGSSSPCLILDHSQRGMRIETVCALHSGEHIRILVLDSAADDAIAGIGHRIGKVRWCSSGPAGPSGLFKVGITMIGGVCQSPGPRRSAG